MASIIIINRNNANLLDRCIKSMKSHISLQHEIIVVDNGSIDNSVSIAKKAGCIVIENKINLGAVVATNQGIKIAKYGDIIRADNDIEIISGSLDDLLLTNGDIIGCKLFNKNGTIQHAGGYFTPNKFGHIGDGEVDNGQYDTEKEVYYLCSALVVIRKTVIDSIGLLDENFSPMYFEDADYCRRAVAAGYKIIYSPKCTAIHHQGMTSKHLTDKHYTFEKNRLRFIKKHYSLSWKFRRLLREILWSIYISLKSRDIVIFKAYIHTIRSGKL